MNGRKRSGSVRKERNNESAVSGRFDELIEDLNKKNNVDSEG